MLTEAGIAYTVLKGSASASYYADPLSRVMGDVDFLVDAADLERASALFCDAGFTAHAENHECHVILRREKTHLEMHHTPPGVPEGEVGARIRSYLSDLLLSSRLIQNRVVTCRCPDDFHHGLILLMHMQHHLLAEGIGLRHLCDWAVFVGRFSDADFRACFEARLRPVGLWRCARLLSLAAVLYLGLPRQDWMGGDAGEEDTAHALMADILAGGNFGRKDRQRMYEGMFISDRGKDGVKNNRIGMAFRSLNRITCTKWPFFEHCRPLLPVGWCMAGAVYLHNNRRRRRQGITVSAADAYQRSAARIALYRKLELYEPET